MVNPAAVVVLPIRFTTTARLVKGRPRQFLVMWQNIRCSILFHLLVPEGKWHTLTFNPVSLASSCNATFHRRLRLPLLPPPSAVIRTRSARGYDRWPISDHQRRIDSTAKRAVSWSMPTLTQPRLQVRS